jgi:predicted GNAT family N-acyltransferase
LFWRDPILAHIPALRYNPKVSKFSYQLVGTDADLEGAFAVRRAVFVVAQGVNEDVVFDGLDGEALQMVVKADEAVVGTARVRFPEVGQAKIERMAVLPPYRGQAIGRGILACLEDELKSRGVKRSILHAQNPVVAFYQACGYRATGTPFTEIGIEHRTMQKRLT